MTAFTIEVKDSEVISALNRLRQSALRPEPALKAIGELLYRQSRKTFETSTDPWGRRWAPNKPSTIAAMLANRSGRFASFTDIATRKVKQGRVGNKRGYFKKDGSLGKAAERLIAGKRPLIGEGKFLSGSSLFHNVAGNELTVGSSAIYAAIQQFGGKKSEFPHLWGDIPARPFLPVRQDGSPYPEEQRRVLDDIAEYLLGR